MMTDPQQTTPIPASVQPIPPTPNQETDFFGGGEDAFQNGIVSPVDPNTPVVASKPFIPAESAWEPTLPAETDGGLSIQDNMVGNGALQEEQVKPVSEIQETTPIPEIEPVEEMEEKIEPIPEIEPVQKIDLDPVHEEKVEPIAKVEPIPEIEEQPEEEIVPIPVSEPIPAPVTVQEQEPVEITGQSELGKKLGELLQLSQHIYDLQKTDEGFQLVGADNDKLQILYRFVIGDPDFPMISITKIETDKTTEEESTHELNFYLNEAGTSLNVNLDEELLFDEEVDLQDDIKKKMQVMEKINKFIFLVTEESRKLEKEMKEKEAEEQEKRKLQDIFRNF